MKDESTSLMISWYAWILQDMTDNNNADTFIEYLGFLDWMKDKFDYGELKEINHIKFTSKTSLSFWFDFDKKFDKRSLIGIDPDSDYEIKKLSGRYTAIEICNSDK